MPGITIHIAIAKRYILKNKDKIIDENLFLKGSIAPDLNEAMTQITKFKDKTHYRNVCKGKVEMHLEDFLEEFKTNLEEDYWKGYFLHLLADKYFYEEIFKDEYNKAYKKGETFYHDYDALNKDLMEKYNIKALKNLEKYMTKVDSNTIYLNKDKIINYIEKMSNLNLNEEKNKVLTI